MQIAFCYNYTLYFLRQLFCLVGKDRSFIGEKKKGMYNGKWVMDDGAKKMDDRI